MAARPGMNGGGVLAGAGAPPESVRIGTAMAGSALVHALLIVLLAQQVGSRVDYYLSDPGVFSLAVRIVPAPAEQKAQVPVESVLIPQPPVVAPPAKAMPQATQPLEQEAEAVATVETPPAQPEVVEQPVPMLPEIRVRQVTFLTPLPRSLDRSPWNDGDYRRDHELDSRPLPIQLVVPEYPEQALADKVEGSVTVALLVDDAGRVVDAAAVDTDEFLADYRDAIAEAMRKSVFSPALQDGLPVRAMVFLQVKFELIAGSQVQILNAPPPRRRRNDPGTGPDQGVF